MRGKLTQEIEQGEENAQDRAQKDLMESDGDRGRVVKTLVIEPEARKEEKTLMNWEL